MDWPNFLSLFTNICIQIIELGPEEQSCRNIAVILEKEFQTKSIGLIVYGEKTFFVERDVALGTQEKYLEEGIVISDTVERICHENRIVVSGHAAKDFPCSESLRDRQVSRLIAVPLGNPMIGILFLEDPNRKIVDILTRDGFEKTQKTLLELGKFLKSVILQHRDFCEKFL